MSVSVSIDDNLSQLETEQVTYECSICYEDVREKGDFFGILDCCDHIHCHGCIIQWGDQQYDKHLIPRCTYCQQVITSVVPSFLPMKPCSNEQKMAFMEFSAIHTERINECFSSFKYTGTPEYCPFNCGFAEVCSDGSLMCPHGLYRKEQYEDEQKKLQKVMKYGSVVAVTLCFLLCFVLFHYLMSFLDSFFLF